MVSNSKRGCGSAWRCLEKGNLHRHVPAQHLGRCRCELRGKGQLAHFLGSKAGQARHGRADKGNHARTIRRQDDVGAVVGQQPIFLFAVVQLFLKPLARSDITHDRHAPPAAEGRDGDLDLGEGPVLVAQPALKGGRTVVRNLRADGGKELRGDADGHVVEVGADDSARLRPSSRQ